MRRALAEPGAVLLVASHPLVISVTRAAMRRMAAPPPILLASDAEALAHLLGPGAAPSLLVVEEGRGRSDGPRQALLSAARDRFSRTGIVLVAPPDQEMPRDSVAVPAEIDRLAAIFSAGGTPGEMPVSDVAALAAGLRRDEITVRFQPIVRLTDRRLVMVEALARWERPAAALGAGDFVPMAERAGLAELLTMAVAQRALAELAALPGRPALRLSFNVPLAVLLKPSLPAWLGPAAAAAGLEPANLLLELTEGTEVRDTSQLRRALRRLGRAGFGVLLDDLGLDDDRRDLLSLPFAGVKLDRGLVQAMPHDRRARAEVQRIVRRARRDGMVVIAEGVVDQRGWRAAAAAGCDLAQGFGVARPLPSAALMGWASAWTTAAMPAQMRAR